MKKILIVDDNAVSRELARDALSGNGYLVYDACDGQQALDLIARVTPDLVLLDIHMPVLNGFETLRQIRANPDLATLPVLAITAFAMQGDAERALEAGFTSYITKPIHIPSLRKDVERFLLEGHE